MVVLGLVGIGGSGFAYLWAHSGARPVSLEEARRRFLRNRVEVPRAARQFTPAEGVYEYRGTGSESLSAPPKSQSEGPRMPGTVEHRDDGCWTFRLDYSTNHWREWDFCPSPTALRQEGSRVYQRWNLVVTTVDNLATLICDPPAVVMETGMEPGDVWDAECRGRNTRISGTTISTGTHTLVAIEPVTVGDVSVDTFHFRDERVVTGAQSGREEFDFWLSADGLPVRGQQRIVVDSDSPLGRVTYTQEGAFVLVRPTPVR